MNFLFIYLGEKGGGVALIKARRFKRVTGTVSVTRSKRLTNQ